MNGPETPAHAVVSPIVATALVTDNVFHNKGGTEPIWLELHKDGTVTWSEAFGRHSADHG